MAGRPRTAGQARSKLKQRLLLRPGFGTGGVLTVVNLMFAFALRYDAITRNPVEGTSPLRKPKAQPQALTLQQIAAIRAAAASWRTEPGLPGPKPDGQVRDIIEVLLGTAMRTGRCWRCDRATSATPRRAWSLR